MECQEEMKIPLLVSLDMVKEAIKTLPIEDIRAIKEIFDEIIAEYEAEKPDKQ